MFSALPNRLVAGVVFAGLAAGGLHAQDIAGDWQGTLQAGTQQLRIILHIGKDSNGGWNGKVYSIDQGPDAIPISSMKLDAANLKFEVDAVGGKYEGKVSPDGQSIDGTWMQGQRLPLEFRRTSKATEWEKDASPHHVQFVTVDGNVKLEVLDWGGTGRPAVLLAGVGKHGARVRQVCAKTYSGLSRVRDYAAWIWGVERSGAGRDKLFGGSAG